MTNPSDSKSPTQTRSPSNASGDIKRLNIVARVDSYSGYGIHLEQICRQLESHGILPTIRATRIMNPKWRPVSTYLRSKLVAGVQPEDEELIIHTPEILPTPGKRSFYWTMYECTNLPKKSVDLLNKAERVLVPSSWNASCFAASGVTTPISIVPLGVDPGVFKPMDPPQDDLIVFGCGGFTGNGRQRKGMDKIIEAFLKAFPDRADVRLHVKCSPVCQVPAQADPRIIITRSFLSPRAMARWYGGLTAFINIATGGWELMAHEAMACGVRVIAPRYGGMADYLGHWYSMPYRMVKAGDIWGHGLWAEVDIKDIVNAMRGISDHEAAWEITGALVRLEAATLTWENSFNRMAEAMAESGIELVGKPETVGCAGSNDLTVAITSFQRPEMLIRAFNSVVASGVKNVAIYSSKPGNEDREAMRECQRIAGGRGIDLRASMHHMDFGCNESWARAAYLARTDRVLLLHDDDVLKPEFGAEYERTIGPAMDKGLAVTWRGEHLHKDGTRTPTEYYSGATRKMPVEHLKDLILKPGQLSLSPIVTVFNRDRLIRAAKECGTFWDHRMFLTSTMLLGTEIIAHLRNLEGKKEWLYLDKVLSSYGVHDGSGTVTAEKSGSIQRLVEGYDLAREYYRKTLSFNPVSRQFIVIRTGHIGFGDRYDYAAKTVGVHKSGGSFVEIWDHVPDARASSDTIGETQTTPYVKDLIGINMRALLPEDVLIFTNDDACMILDAPNRIARAVAKGHGMTASWRRSFTPDRSRFYSDIRFAPTDGGVDMFAFTPAAWALVASRMPDMLFGREVWDWVMRDIGERLFGPEIYSDDIIYHEPHFPGWKKDPESKGQKHNRQLAREYFKSVGNVRAAESLS